MRDAVPRVPGRPPKLTIEQARRIYTLVVGIDPRQLRFDFALWTRDMVAELIVGEFGIALSRTAVGRLLRRMGVSPQRPLWRARQADPPGVQRWKNEEFESNGVEVSDYGLRRMVITGFGAAPTGGTPRPAG